MFYARNNNAFKCAILSYDMSDNYSQLVSRISEAAGLSPEDIERKVEGKRAKLSGLVSKEGAAQIVASELGINFDQERMKISELVHGMKRVNVIGKILDISPIREFNKNGREGRVCNLLIADESSNTRAVLWDEHHILLVEKGKLIKQDIVEISNANIRNGELHLGSFSDIKKSKEKLGEVVIGKVYSNAPFRDVKPGEKFKTRAFVVQISDPRYFSVCSECGKKVIEGKCAAHGNVQAKNRALLSVVLDDGSETMRSVLFSEQISKLGIVEEELFSLEKFAVKKAELLGEERFFAGSLRKNEAFNSIEMTIEDVLDVNPEMLIKELEGKS